MTIRITGMNSGLDTESIIQELASARSVKVQNVQKEQTKLSWKIDAWKELNAKIYALYTDVLSDMRFDYAYSKKTTKASNPNAVSVVTGSDAVNGVQYLKVNNIATSAYLSGAEVKVAGKKATGDTKLSDLGQIGEAKLKLTVGGKEQEIKLSEKDTLADVAKKFGEAGLNAKFDNASGRFFVSAKESGSAGNFTIGSAAYGIPSDLNLKQVLLQKVPATWGTLTEADQKMTDLSETDYNAKRNEIIAINKQAIQDKIADIEAINAYIGVDDEKLGLQKIELPTDWDTVSDEQITEITNKILANNNIIVQEESARQGDIMVGVLGLSSEEYDPTVPNWSPTSAGKGTMISGRDSEIVLNGAKYTSSGNTFEINGLTITALQKTKDDEMVTLTTQQDTDGIYDVIKNFITKYNELINEMDKLYGAASAAKYQPLTKEEKDAMSEKEIEEWEKKIKESLLRRDSTLFSVSDVMKRAMSETHLDGIAGINDGKDIYLSFFGIETLGYFKSKDNEKNAYHINGNADDSSVKNNEEKLKKAIASDPDTVTSFFKKLATKLYTELDGKMGRTDYSSAFTVYNDKQMEKELKNYESKVSTEQKKLNEYIDRWYSKFSQMEVALSKIQSKESSISSLFSG